MRALHCLDGSNTERLVRATFSLLNADGLRVVLLYVIDSGPGHEMERLRQRFVGTGQRGAHLLAQVMQAEQEAGERALTAMLTALRERWPAAEQIESVILRGRPQEEIVRLAAEQGIDLILVGARRVLGPGEPPHPPGPKSVGHVARFVLDHAPCPVLLLRP